MENLANHVTPSTSVCWMYEKKITEHGILIMWSHIFFTDGKTVVLLYAYYISKKNQFQ